MSEQLHNRLYWLLLFGYLAITIAYAVVNPLFEAPDEHKHFFVAVYIAETGELPVVDASGDDYLQQEAAQPPLYYWLASGLIGALDLSVAQVGEDLWFNRFVRMGDASSPTNINHFVHDSAENWPWSGWVAGAHRLRVFSTLFGLLTLSALYQCGRALWPKKRDRALLAMGLVALLPQFNFLHSYINNDVAIILFATLTLWQLISLWRREMSTLAHFVGIGITVALAMLSKTAGLLLLVYAIGFILIWAWRHQRWQIGTRGIGIVATIDLLCAGWLLLRNWQLYGDLTAANQFVAIAGGDREMTLLGVLAETPGIVYSLFGVFGWFNVRGPEWLFAIWFGFVIIAITTSMRSIFRASFTTPQRDHPLSLQQRIEAIDKKRLLALLLFGWVLAVYAGMVLFMLRTPAAQGRLLFPAIVPLALGLSYGLSNVPKLSRHLWIWFMPALATTFFVVAITIPQTYRPMDSIVSLPEASVRVEQQLAPNVELVGYQLLGNRLAPGDDVWVDLYWRATGPIGEAPDLVLELFGRNNDLIGKLQTLHGAGLDPATLWTPNEIRPEHIAVQIKDEIETPIQAKVSVRIVDGESADLGFVKIGAETDVVELVEEPLAQFGDGIVLISAEIDKTELKPDETLHVNVRWHVTADQHQTLSTLLHLGPTGVAPLAQGDSTPLQGDYPTHWWSTGEQFEDQYTITIPSDIPSGIYPLRIGFYDAAFVRLAASPDDGDQTFQIGEIDVKELD